MMDAFLKGITIGLLLAIAVGPVLFAVVKQSLNNGHKGGMAFAFGVSLSDILLVLVINVFTELFAQIRQFEKTIGITGCIFLIGVGLYFLFFKKVSVDKEGQQVFKHSKSDLLKISISGFLMNLLNPSIILFWIWVSSTVISFPISDKIVLFITGLSIGLLADIAKVFLAGKIRNRLTPHNIHIINRLNGIILIGFGVVLLWGLIFYSDKLH